MDGVETELKREIRKGVSLLRVRNGDVSPAILLGLARAAEDDMDARKSHHEQHGHDDHDHDDFESFVVSRGAIADKNTFLASLKETIAAHDILRLKGFIDLEGADARLVVQAVGPRIESYFDRPWGANETRHSSLVVIGEKGLDEAAIRTALEG